MTDDTDGELKELIEDITESGVKVRHASPGVVVIRIWGKDSADFISALQDAEWTQKAHHKPLEFGVWEFVFTFDPDGEDDGDADFKIDGVLR